MLVSEEQASESAAPELVSVEQVSESAAPELVSVEQVSESAAPELVSEEQVSELAAPELVSEEQVSELAAPELVSDLDPSEGGVSVSELESVWALALAEALVLALDQEFLLPPRLEGPAVTWPLRNLLVHMHSVR